MGQKLETVKTVTSSKYLGSVVAGEDSKLEIQHRQQQH